MSNFWKPFSHKWRVQWFNKQLGISFLFFVCVTSVEETKEKERRGKRQFKFNSLNQVRIEFKFDYNEMEFGCNWTMNFVGQYLIKWRIKCYLQSLIKYWWELLKNLTVSNASNIWTSFAIYSSLSLNGEMLTR